MKTTKIITYLVNFIFVLCIFYILYYLYEMVLPPILEINAPIMYSFQVSGYPLTLKIIAVVKMSLIIIFVVGFYHLKKSMKFFILKDFFSLNLIKCFSKSGRLLIVYGLLNIMFSFVLKFHQPYHLIEIYTTPYFHSIFIVLFGLIFVFFKNILAQGFQIQQENNLTI